jgi:hypothetical protein
MNVTLALCALVATIVVLSAVTVAREFSLKRSQVLLRMVAEGHERNLTTAAAVAGLLETFAKVSQRPANETSVVIDALISDRNRLVSAMLASSANPTAARIVGMVDQANVNAQRGADREQVAEMMRNMAMSAPTEYDDGDGHPIIPVGLGSG